MRLTVSVAVLSLFTFSSAGDGIFGTKVSPVTTNGTESTVGFFPVVQMVLALIVVLALVKWVMPLLVKKYSNRSVKGSTGGIRIEETTTMGPANLSVVSVRGRTLLLGATAENVTCLADLTVVEAEPPTFQDLLDESPGTAPYAPGPLTDLAGQLDRLRRIGQ